MVAATAINSIEAAVIITDGTEAAVTTSGATIAVIINGKSFAAFAFVTHCPGESELQRCERVAPSGARPVQRRHRLAADDQPSPISTEIRIRSE
jgi:hypothetical protein